MTNLEDNRHIVKFMDLEAYVYDGDTEHPYLDIYPTDLKAAEENGLPMLEFCFSDYNSLMPVVFKALKTIGYKTVDECTNEEWHITTRLTTLPIGTPLKTIYTYLVAYIKWYNKQKS